MSDRIPHQQMAEALNGLVYGKACWLSDFSDGKRKRPSHEIEARRHELAVLQQAATDYRQAAERAA